MVRSNVRTTNCHVYGVAIVKFVVPCAGRPGVESFQIASVPETLGFTDVTMARQDTLGALTVTSWATDPPVAVAVKTPIYARSSTSCTATGSSTCPRPRCGPRCSIKACTWARSRRSTAAAPGRRDAGAAPAGHPPGHGAPGAGGHRTKLLLNPARRCLKQVDRFRRPPHYPAFRSHRSTAATKSARNIFRWATGTLSCDEPCRRWRWVEHAVQTMNGPGVSPRCAPGPAAARPAPQRQSDCTSSRRGCPAPRPVNQPAVAEFRRGLQRAVLGHAAGSPLAGYAALRRSSGLATSMWAPCWLSWSAPSVGSTPVWAAKPGS